MRCKSISDGMCKAREAHRGRLTQTGSHATQAPQKICPNPTPAPWPSLKYRHLQP